MESDGCRGYRTATLLLLYFLLGIQSTLFVFSVRMDFKAYELSIAQLTTTLILIQFIWYVKFIPAFISDRWGINGMHRKPYMIISNMLAVLICMSLGISSSLPLSAYICLLFVLNIATCFADIAYDGCLVEDVRNSRKRTTIMLGMQIVRIVGYLIGNLVGPLAWNQIHSRGVYLTGTCIYFLSFFLSITFYDFRRTKNVASSVYSRDGITPDVQTHEETPSVEINANGIPVRPIRIKRITCEYLGKITGSVFNNRMLRQMLLFNFIVNLSPGTGQAMFFYLVDELQFGPGNVAIMGAVNNIAQILANVEFVRCYDIPILSLYMVASVIAIATSLVPLFISVNVPRYYVEQLHNETIPETNLITIAMRIYSVGNETVSLNDNFGIDAFTLYTVGDALSTMADVLRDLPVMFLTASICERSVEAGAYAAVLSLLNAGAGMKCLVEAGLISLLGINFGKFQNIDTLIVVAFVGEIVVSAIGCFILPRTKVREVVETGNENSDGNDKEFEVEMTLARLQTESTNATEKELVLI